MNAPFFAFGFMQGRSKRQARGPRAAGEERLAWSVAHDPRDVMIASSPPFLLDSGDLKSCHGMSDQRGGKGSIKYRVGSWSKSWSSQMGHFEGQKDR